MRDACDGRRTGITSCLSRVAGMSIAHEAVGDAMTEAHAMVSLIEQSWVAQIDVAHAFGRDERSVRRYQCWFEDGVPAALGCSGGYPVGRQRMEDQY